MPSAQAEHKPTPSPSPRGEQDTAMLTPQPEVEEALTSESETTMAPASGDFAMQASSPTEPVAIAPPAMAPMAAPAVASPMEGNSAASEGEQEEATKEKDKETQTAGEPQADGVGGDAGGGDEGQGGAPSGGGDEAEQATDQSPSDEEKTGAEQEEGGGDEQGKEEASEPSGEAEQSGKASGSTPEQFQKSGKQLDQQGAVKQVADPEKDPAFQAEIAHSEAVETQKKAHQPATEKVTETKDFGQLPVEEQASKNDQLGHIAAMNTVAEAEEKKKEPFTPETFKKLLKQNLDSLEDQLPKNESDAKRFKREKPIEKVKENIAGQVKEQNETVSGPLASQAEKEPPASDLPTAEPKDLPPAQQEPAPEPINAESSVPKPKNDSELSMEKESQSLDDYMADNEVTEEQLAKSNEPKFIEALDSKTEAQKQASAAPEKYRQQENAKLDSAKQEASETGSMGFMAMDVARTDALTSVATGQQTTGQSDKDQQKVIFKKLETIYNSTKEQVTKKLDGLSEKVDDMFATRAEQAKKTFENNVEERLDDIYGITVIDDWLFGEDTEAIEKAFQIEKGTFIRTMNTVLDDIAKIIADELNATLKIIKDGKKESEDYFKTLSKDQQKLAQDAFDDFNDQYDTLEETVYEKQDELAQDLAQAYKENVDSLREVFDEIKDRVSAGWIGAAFNFIAGVIKTILKIKDLLFNLISAAIDAIGAIISDPIGFLGNLISGIKQGFENFFKNIKKNILTGLIEWLTGSLGNVGIQVPDDLFSLSGIFSLVTQILGLTWDYFRSKAVKLLGEPMVNAMEKGFELFQIIREKGIEGLWEHIKEQFTDLKEMVMDAIRDMIITKVIEAGIKWVMGLLSPAGAFIKAAMMIIDIVKFFVERAAQIFDLVQAFIDGIRALASGNVSAVANAIEKALVKAIPILIGFLASLVGITGLTGKVQKIIKKVRKKIDKAITKIIKKAKKAFGKLVKKGKAKVKGAVGRILNWMGIKKSFKAKDGKSHKLFFKKKGKKAELTVASKPSRVESFLERNREEMEEIDAGRYQKAMNLAVRIRELSESAGAITNTDSSANKTKLKNLNDQMLHSMDRLSSHLIILMGGVSNVPKPEAPQWIYKPAFGKYPKKASVLRLTKDKTTGGTTPDNSNPPWDYFRGDPYLSSHWVQLHLINMKLGGKGIAANLVPGPGTTNSRMEQYSENPLKASLDKNRKKAPKLSHDNVLWVDSTVDYYNDSATKNGNTYYFAKNVLVEGGFHFYNPEKNKWVKNKNATFKRNFPIPMPRDTAKPAVNLRDANIVEILEVDFSAVNVNRAAFKSRLDLYTDEFLEIRKSSNSFSIFETNLLNHFAGAASPTRQNIHILLSYFRNMLGNNNVTIWR